MTTRVRRSLRDRVRGFLPTTSRQFKYLIGTDTLSLLGDQSLSVALPLYYYDRTGDASAAVAILFAHLVPVALLAAVGGAVADRTDRRRLLIGVSFLRVVLVLPLVGVATGAFPGGVAFAVTALLAAAAQLTVPAIGASLPSVVTLDDLPRANAALAARSVLVQLVAPSLGAALYVAWGLNGVVVLTVALFIGGGLVAQLLQLETPEPRSQTGFWADMKEGYGLVRADPLMWALLLSTTIALAGMSIELSVFIPYVRSVLDGSATAVGVLTSGEALGALLGAALAPRVLRRVGVGTMLRIGMCGLPLATTGFLLSRTVGQAAVGLLLAGLLLTVLLIGAQVYVQSTIATDCLGRVLGVMGSMVGLSSVFGAGAALVLTHVTSLRVCLVIAVSIEVLALVTYLVLARGKNPTTAPDAPRPAA